MKSKLLAVAAATRLSCLVGAGLLFSASPGNAYTYFYSSPFISTSFFCSPSEPVCLGISPGIGNIAASITVDFDPTDVTGFFSTNLLPPRVISASLSVPLFTGCCSISGFPYGTTPTSTFFAGISLIDGQVSYAFVNFTFNNHGISYSLSLTGGEYVLMDLPDPPILSASGIGSGGSWSEGQLPLRSPPHSRSSPPVSARWVCLAGAGSGSAWRTNEVAFSNNLPQ